MDNNPSKSSLEDIKKSALEHYNDISLKAHRWNSFIAQAIEQYQEWIIAEDQLPPNKKCILGWDGKCVYVCNYYREHQQEVDCEDDDPGDDVESDEKNDCYWLKPGFYETLEQHGGYYDEISIKRNITHWMPLPPPPTKY